MQRRKSDSNVLRSVNMALLNGEHAIDEHTSLLGKDNGAMKDSDGAAGQKLFNTAKKSITGNAAAQVMTGRQRKKVAARSKGGDFINQRKKRRVYFACVAEEIDVQDLYDYLTGSGGAYAGWHYHIFDKVLWMYKSPSSAGTGSGSGTSVAATDSTAAASIASMYQLQQPDYFSGANWVSAKGTKGSARAPSDRTGAPSMVGLRRLRTVATGGGSSLSREVEVGTVHAASTREAEARERAQRAALLGSTQGYNIVDEGAQEVFVFDFGATVMWGFNRMEEANMLKTVRMFATKGVVSGQEFERGEDDMGFIMAPTEVIAAATAAAAAAVAAAASGPGEGSILTGSGVDSDGLAAAIQIAAEGPSKRSMDAEGRVHTGTSADGLAALGERRSQLSPRPRTPAAGELDRSADHGLSPVPFQHTMSHDSAIADGYVMNNPGGSAGTKVARDGNGLLLLSPQPVTGTNGSTLNEHRNALSHLAGSMDSAGSDLAYYYDDSATGTPMNSQARRGPETVVGLGAQDSLSPLNVVDAEHGSVFTFDSLHKNSSAGIGFESSSSSDSAASSPLSSHGGALDPSKSQFPVGGIAAGAGALLSEEVVNVGLAHLRQSAGADASFTAAEDPALDQAISVANDLLVIPLSSSPKQRLSISFAIAQSSVLSVFESRVQDKIEAYKYIPEALAKSGALHDISQRQIGIMIGEIFAVQHDVNLHSEILDEPDFFGSENKQYLMTYKVMHQYLEMSNRAEILNKRLTLMRELLNVLQRQMERDHGTELEWIVIWLIAISIVLEMFAVVFAIYE